MIATENGFTTGVEDKVVDVFGFPDVGQFRNVPGFIEVRIKNLALDLRRSAGRRRLGRGGAEPSPRTNPASTCRFPCSLLTLMRVGRSRSLAAGP